MKKICLVILISIFCVTQNLESQKKKVSVKSEKEKMAYAIGLDLGKRVFAELKKVDMPKDQFLLGISDGVIGAKTELNDSLCMVALNQFEGLLNQQRQKEVEIEGEKRLTEGKLFLAENQKKDSIVTLPSGLQYKILVNGKGKKPKSTDTVVTNYRGTLIDGTEFDNSHTRGEPASFPVDRVIKGWTEALQLMSVGSKWELFIPSELAYGSRQRSEVILPNSVLIFTIELLDVK